MKGRVKISVMTKKRHSFIHFKTLYTISLREVTECLYKEQTFFESICENFQLESGIWMDGYNYQKKGVREKQLFTNVVQCINTTKT